LRTGESWAQTYPRDRDAHAGLAGTYQWVGKYEQSAEAGKRTIEAEADFPPGYVNRAWAFIFLDRLNEAEQVLRQAIGHKLQTPDLLILPYYMAFLRGDKAGMARAEAAGKEVQGVEDWISHAEAFVDAWSGHLQEARRLTRRGVDLAQQAHQPERAAIFEAGAAVREALFGYPAEAKAHARAALDLSHNRDVQYGAAFAFAASGDASRALTLTADLEKRFAEDTCVKFTYAPVLHAMAGLQAGPEKGIELLQVTVPYDLAIPCSWFGFYGNLYSVYARGKAYLSAHKYAEAAAEFQRILDHRAIVFADPVGIAARLELARALVLAGDTTKAKTAYQDLLTLWKDADTDIPILTEAKREFARL
jgi:tetratricopeptide (TPR) repeat protein